MYSAICLRAKGLLASNSNKNINNGRGNSSTNTITSFIVGGTSSNMFTNINSSLSKVIVLLLLLLLICLLIILVVVPYCKGPARLRLRHLRDQHLAPPADILYMYMCICVYIYIYIDICTHTCTHMCTYHIHLASMYTLPDVVSAYIHVM